MPCLSYATTFIRQEQQLHAVLSTAILLPIVCWDVKQILVLDYLRLILSYVHHSFLNIIVITNIATPLINTITILNFLNTVIIGI